MSKFDSYGVLGVEKKLAQDKQNTKLKEKYKIDENVVVVEKTNTFKFILSTAKGVIKTICTVAILLLACIGLYLLIIPERREVLIRDISDVINQIQSFIGM